MPPVRGGAAKWKQRSQAAQADYTAGIRNPRRAWDQAAIEGAQNWASGLQAAIADGRFAKGVQKAGQRRWQEQAATLGAQRFSQGVQASGDRYEQGFAPYRATIEGVNLPPRRPRGDPANLERVRVIDEALHAQKLAGGGR